MPTPISLPLQSYELRTAQASTSALTNCYLETLPDGSPWPYRLARCDGLASWGTVGSGVIEGMHVSPAHNLLGAVSSGAFYTVTTAAAATSRGAVGSSTTIDIDSNDIGFVIVSEPNAYSFTVSGSSFAQITDGDFLGAGDVEFNANTMLFRDPDTGVFFGAELGSLTSFDSLDFATAEGSPDHLVGLKSDHDQALLFGAQSLEIWAKAEISGFPYQRLSPGYIERGCANGKTIAKNDQTVAWVADDLTVRVLRGLTPERISTHAIEQFIRGATLASMRGYAYSREGHSFYLLTAPEGCRTYDFTTGLWHSRETYDRDTWDWGHPVNFAGKILLGSTTSNVIAELDPEVYADLGETQRMAWKYQPVYPAGPRVFFDRLEVVCEVGVGLTSGQGSDPQIMCDFSDNGGRTWISLPNRSLGAIGRYETRVFWSALGSCASAHGRVWRMAVSDPVPVTILDTLLTIRGGR
jgi:hypothetical protein